MANRPVPQWRWQILERAADLDPVPPVLSEAAAQDGCNFTVWRPTVLPAGCDSSVGTLRREAPPGRVEAEGRTPWSDANPAGYRTEISGGGRRLRLKQFHYDWAFPAADHPCLWGSETRPYEIGEGRVAWLGTDYLGHRAGSARMARTTVELSVLEGEFTDEELVALFAALRPAVPEAAERILATPFAELSYWARHRADMVSVPTGVFSFHRRDKKHEGDWIPSADVAAFLAAQGVPVTAGGFRAESAATFGDGAAVRELEVVYASPDGAELRLTAQRTGGGRLEFPPVREKHPATEELHDLDGRPLHLGHVDAEYGACDAWWQHPDGYDLRLLGSAGTGLGREAFLGLVAGIDADLRLAGNAEVLG
ncbi:MULTISPECIES: hypothetical protein [Streptomyces]|uniref:Uncharacterized protein n=1 Tax=Streptomyces viridochromogenes TaxID=1938 RepID=A0A0L8KJU5_STRVR|nr:MULTISPECIES: hypothetical protein [Streptomyces]KOG26233.1 hypothetical protein ADK34_16700 [Streptomyces viridochromogenes]